MYLGFVGKIVFVKNFKVFVLRLSVKFFFKVVIKLGVFIFVSIMYVIMGLRWLCVKGYKNIIYIRYEIFKICF